MRRASTWSPILDRKPYGENAVNRKVKIILVNMDNIKGSVKETLTKAAAKITKQMSTDDTRDSLAKKSQSQIELRENVRYLNKT